jgi:polysaccharide pyruvyl transferase WcaK-like protein
MNLKKVAIIGGSFWGNRGAAAMLETTIAKVREINPEAIFTIFTPYPEIDNSLVHDGNFTFVDSKPLALIRLNIKVMGIWLLSKIGLRLKPAGVIKSIMDAHVLLDIGGITFADGRLIFLPYNILTILPALLFEIPVVKLSQAAGSFNNPIIRFCAKYFLPKCEFIFARGEKTLAFLQELEFSENKVSMAMDVTFVFQEDYCLTNENNYSVQQIYDGILSKKSQGIPVIGISPSILVMGKMGSKDADYVHYLVEMIRKTSFQQDVHFVVFPNASREKSKKKRNNDILAIEEMQNRAKLELPLSIYNKITWMTFDIDTKGINKIVSKLDLLITSRFHAMVFGLRLAIPTIVIGWSHKYHEVMNFFGLEAFVFDYQNPNQSFDEMILEVIKNNETYRSKIKQQLPKASKLSQKQFDYLKRFLD